jgi:LasA protease
VSLEPDGGPTHHLADGHPRGALDFAPITGEPAVRSFITLGDCFCTGAGRARKRGVVALDLDGDGDEGTGWVLVYMHIAEQGPCSWPARGLKADAPIGHPSCEGGRATGDTRAPGAQVQR